MKLLIPFNISITIVLPRKKPTKNRPLINFEYSIEKRGRIIKYNIPHGFIVGSLGPTRALRVVFRTEPRRDKGRISYYSRILRIVPFDRWNT